MTRWQYLEAKLIPAGTLPLQFMVNKEHELRYDLVSDKVYTLNELGNEGWNFIQIVQLPDEIRFIFRRSA